jgi:hypothetical protein
MGHPVQERRGHPLPLEHLRPVGERQVVTAGEKT